MIVGSTLHDASLSIQVIPRVTFLKATVLSDIFVSWYLDFMFNYFISKVSKDIHKKM